MWLPITVELWLTDVLAMCLHCGQVGTCWVHGSFSGTSWMYPKTRLTFKMYLKMSHVHTCPQCKHIARTSVSHNSTVIGNHIAGTCWGYISNVKDVYLVGTLEANVEVTFEIWVKCIWQEYWRNFLPKPEMFPICKYPFSEALASSASLSGHLPVSLFIFPSLPQSPSFSCCLPAFSWLVRSF